jgi:DNA-binding transcriptional MerR regulator
MPDPIPIAPTVGEIARRYGVPIHGVEYVIRSLKIRPSGRAGNCRIFREEDVERLAAHLRLIDGEKGATHSD